MQETAVRPVRRADAQRNYDRILAVTRAAVAECGGTVALEEIARSAGVGIGTLYRHFPTRQALLEAAFLDEAQELQRRAEELASAATPFEALVTWLRYQLVFGAHGRSMGAAVMNAKHVEGTEIRTACLAMRESGAVLLAQAAAAGAVRPDIELADILRLIHGALIANEQAPDADQLERMFDMVVAGIRAS